MDVVPLGGVITVSTAGSASFGPPVGATFMAQPAKNKQAERAVTTEVVERKNKDIPQN